MIPPVEILWTQYADGSVRYYAAIPNTHRQERRWVWQARLDRRRYLRWFSAATPVRTGVLDPEPNHGGFI